MVAALFAVAANFAATAPEALGGVDDNDNFPGFTIDSLPYSDLRDTTSATNQPGEPVSACVFPDPIAASVWYRYVAAGEMSLVATTAGSNFDTVVAVWTDSEFPGGGLVEVACNDDTGSSLESRVSITTEAGRAYYFQVGGYPFGQFESGNLVFNLDVAPPPPNDNRDNATAIGPLPFNALLDTSGATAEPDEPAPSCLPGPPANTVWFAFTAAAGTAIDIDTSGSSFDTALAVWRPTANGLVEEGCVDDFGFSAQARLGIQLIGGVYLIQVGGFPFDSVGFSSAGSLVLVVRELTIPECAQATVRVNDPPGDTFGVGPGFDIRSVGVGFSGDAACFTVEFDGPTSGVAGSEDSVPLMAVLPFDTDRDPQTGILEPLDFYCPQPTGLGADAEARVDSRNLLAPLVTFAPPVPAGNPNRTDSGIALAAPGSFTLVVPTGALEDGSFGFAVALGSDFETTDCAPNGGSIDTAGPSVPFGDADCSGAIDAVDALAVLREVAALPTTAGCLAHADVNCSGARDAVDAMIILRFTAGLPPNQPPGCPALGWA